MPPGSVGKMYSIHRVRDSDLAPWKALVDPRTWPKPGEVKAGIAATATAVATTQAKEHPFVVAVKQDPPVLNSEWAAAVAEADARAAAREAERAAEAHGGKAVSPARVTASAGARPRA